MVSDEIGNHWKIHEAQAVGNGKSQANYVAVAGSYQFQY